MTQIRIPSKLQEWIDARKRHHLSHAHVQMARELGMNPRKLGKLDNHKQEPWKAPLPAFIDHLYHKRFGKARPDVVLSIEELAEKTAAKKAARHEAECSQESNELENVKIGVAWYQPEQWDRLREISDDRETLEKTYQEWLAIAENTCATLAKEGVRVEKVLVDIAELEAWCRSQGMPISAQARSHFVSEHLRLRYKGGEQR